MLGSSAHARGTEKARHLYRARSADCAGRRGGIGAGHGWTSPLHSFLISADISSGRNRNAGAAGLATNNAAAAGSVTTRMRRTSSSTHLPRHGAASAPGVARGFFKGAAAREAQHGARAPHSCARRLHGGLASPMGLRTSMPISLRWVRSVRKTQDSLRPDQVSAERHPADWAAAAQMVFSPLKKRTPLSSCSGLTTAVAIREPAADKSDNKPGDKKDARRQAGRQAFGRKTRGEAGWRSQGGGSRIAAGRCGRQQWRARPATGPEKSAGSPNDLMSSARNAGSNSTEKKIDEMIGVLKAKGVPVLWVGLPAVRGAKAIRRHGVSGYALSRCGRQGRHHLCRCLGTDLSMKPGAFCSKAPISKGRSAGCAPADGVYFTRPARSSSRIMPSANSPGWLAARSAPIVLPTEPATPDANARPDQPARPLAGPIVPRWPLRQARINCSAFPGSRQVAIDAQAARLLIRGEPCRHPPVAPMTCVATTRNRT